GGSIAYGRYVNSNACLPWTTARAANTGSNRRADGSNSTSGRYSVARPLACCIGAPQPGIAGFRAPSATMGGRPAMHAASTAELAGAHMCYTAEYIRTASPIAIPATGAWLDPSISETGTFITSSGSPTFGRYVNSNAC